MVGVTEFHQITQILHLFRKTIIVRFFEAQNDHFAVCDMDDGMTLEGLRFLVGAKKMLVQFSLRPYGDRGMAIRFQLSSHGFSKRPADGWLLAEKSKRVRVFSRAETAFGVLCSLGIESFQVDLRAPGEQRFPRSKSY